MQDNTSSGFISIDDLGQMYPFCLVVKSNGVLAFCTPTVKRLVAAEQQNLFDHVTIENPKNIKNEMSKDLSGKTILLNVNRSGLKLRGTFRIGHTTNHVDPRYVFVGVPVITTIEQTERYGLLFSDFSILDTIFDFLLLLQSQSKTIDDLKLMQKLLDEERVKSTLNAKLASLGEMSAGIAHEINNPLAILSSNINLIEKSLKTSPSQIDMNSKLDRIKKAIFRIDKIVKSLKKYSRSQNETEPMQTASLSEVVEEAL